MVTQMGVAVRLWENISVDKEAGEKFTSNRFLTVAAQSARAIAEGSGCQVFSSF